MHYVGRQDLPSLVCSVIFFSLLLAQNFNPCFNPLTTASRVNVCCSSQSKIIAALVFEFVHFGLSIWTATAKVRCGPLFVGNATTGDFANDDGFIFDCYGHNKLKMGVGIPTVLLLVGGMLNQLDDLRTMGAKQAQQHLADDDVPLRRL
jgi:hypothetical protein